MKRIFYISIIIFPILFFCISFLWSINLPMDLAPDEYMRIDIPFWIIKNSKLPIGNETELLNPIWGISYAFTPYLPSLIACFFIKITSIFTSDYRVLLIAARFVSVLSGTITIVICSFIGKEIFKKIESILFLQILIGLLPQYLFLSSYFNNDTFSILSTSIIFLSWIKGIKYNWTIKNCFLLIIGISMEALTYYNGYGWILCSILIVSISIFNNDLILNKKVYFTKRFVFVFLISFLLAGWFFIRNYFIYQGDIFGLKASSHCAEINALPEFKPSLRPTLKNSGKSFFSILINLKWWILSAMSFIGVFGYMSIYLKPITYIIYFSILSFGLICFFYYLKKNKSTYKIVYIFITIICIIIPLILSLYYSFANDFQPQGRYLMPCLIPLFTFIILGYESFCEYSSNKFFNSSDIFNIQIFSELIYIFMFILVFFFTILSKCF